MSRHILVVEPDTAYAERFPDFPPETRWHIECPDGNGCSGWEECDGDHSSLTEDDQDEGYATAHGVEHEYRWGYGWTVPYEGCVVAGNDSTEPPDELWKRDEDSHNLRLPLGRWVVDDDWDETHCTLILVGPEDGEEK